MRITRSLELHTGSQEEKLPYASADFPYVASRAELNDYRESFVPWHWHGAVELFYMESGELQYQTPHKTAVFPAGSAGMVNANVLHMTKIQTPEKRTVQLLHLFDPRLLAGEHGSAIEKKYILPILASSQVEILSLCPDDARHAAIIERIRSAFLLDESKMGYELLLREALSNIWLLLFEICFPVLQKNPQPDNRSNHAAEKAKRMMVYIHEHYAEKISVPELAASAFLSERECYRVFQAHLHMTPSVYIKSCRLQAACQMLADSQMPITEIAYACGLGNASYFGSMFRKATGCTPLQYRRKWQNHNRK